MLEAGNLLLFKPFYFEDGTYKNKFFIVISQVDDFTILATLPTKVNRAPSLVTTNHGCINIDERRYNCYLFEPRRQVCTNGFCFDLPTFVYGSDVADFQVMMFAKYINDPTTFTLIGKITEDELNNLKDCLRQSGSVKRKIKKML